MLQLGNFYGKVSKRNESVPPPSNTLIKTARKIHLIEFDYIRVIAMLFVIAVHTLAVIDFKDPVSLFYFQLMQIIFFTCNGMFFLMSGKFALIERQSLTLPENS